jgi:hypothetical protein
MAKAMQSFEFSSAFGFTWSVFRHWGALVTGGILIGCLSIWQGTGHYVPPTIYWIVAIVGIFVACYKAWNEERKAKEGALAALNTQSGTTSAEWKDLANRLEKVGLNVSAQWQCNRRNNQTTFENWTFSGTYSKPCETLCRFAGTLLAKSPHVSRKVSKLALEQSDPAWRWLFFLKENHDALALGSGMPPIGDDGTIYLMGTISNVAAVSARVCMECAALEL